MVFYGVHSTHTLKYRGSGMVGLELNIFNGSQTPQSKAVLCDCSRSKFDNAFAGGSHICGSNIKTLHMVGRKHLVCTVILAGRDHT